jgi:hypothetical protein
MRARSVWRLMCSLCLSNFQRSLHFDHILLCIKHTIPENMQSLLSPHALELAKHLNRIQKVVLKLSDLVIIIIIP